MFSRAFCKPMLRDKRIVIVDWLPVDTKHDDGNLRGQWAISRRRNTVQRHVWKTEYREHVFSSFFKFLFFLISSTIRSNVQHYQNSYTLSILPSRGNTYKKIKHFSSTKQKRISEKVTRTYSNLGTSLRTNESSRSGVLQDMNIWERGEGRGTRGERFSAAGGGVLLCERADLWTLSQP